MGLEAGLGEALRTDYFLLREEFTPAQLGYLERTRGFVHDEVLPVINGYWERAEFPWPLVKKLGAAGLVGDGIAGYGCPEMDPLSAGLVTMELNRGDGSLGTFLGVQAGLAMRSIAMLGSEEQKQRWLPAMARVDKLGAFALTEPDHGSDSVAPGDHRPPRRRRLRDRREEEVDRQRHAGRRGRGVGPGRRRRPGEGVPRREGDAGLPRAADRGEGLAARGVAGRDRPGRRAGARREQAAGRGVVPRHRRRARQHPGHLRVGRARPRGRRLRRGAGLRRAAHPVRPAAGGFQLVQDRLVKMLAKVTAMQLYCRRLADLALAGRVEPTLAGLAKSHNTTAAREVLAEARDLLGGNGILLDFHVIRHMADIEAIHTFEGTATIQNLIVGRDITGLSAFAAGA